MADGWLADALDSGRIANLDHVACAVASRVSDGPAAGCRALDLRVYGGIDVRVLPDRGFDLGAASYRGVPLAWTSAVGETGPLSDPRGTAWNDAFGGGLVATCGLRNVGAPSEGFGQHGAFSSQRAGGVAVTRKVVDGEAVLTARATIVEAQALGVHLSVERTVTTRTGRGLVELSDITTNRASRPAAAPLLYHVNLGAPLWEPPSRLQIRSSQVRPRDADAEAALDRWRSPPPPRAGAPEQVFEHVVEPLNGWGEATVTSPALGLRVTLAWDAKTLPRFHQWVHPAPGVYALGLEPANCSVLGRAADRAAGTLPMLGPGESRTTRLRITAEALDAAVGQ